MANFSKHYMYHYNFYDDKNILSYNLRLNLDNQETGMSDNETFLLKGSIINI